MIQPYLDAFQNIERNYSGSINDCIHLDFKKHTGHIVIGSIIHGNETGSLPAVIQIVEELIDKKYSFGGKISLFLGNKKAALANKRFLEHDLNRCFAFADTSAFSHEKKRAVELKELLKTADVFIDFHQTTRACKEPFYIFAMHNISYLWARAIGVSKVFVTRKSTRPYSAEGMCSDEFVRLLQKPGITLELGAQGINSFATKTCLSVIKNTLKLMDEIKFKKRKIADLARKKQDFKLLELKYYEKFRDGNMKLTTDLYNLQKVTKQQLLGTLNKDQYFYAPVSGYILFPQYPERNQSEHVIEPLPTYIYSLAIDANRFPK